MDTFKIVQSKDIEEREALKQMQTFLKREEQSQLKEVVVTEPGVTRVEDNVVSQIKTVKDALVTSQGR